MTAFLTLTGLLFLSPPVRPAPEPGAEKSREFRFTYEATVKGLRKGQVARIWLPVPPSNEEQKVQRVAQRLPAKAQIAKEPKYGNAILYLEAEADVGGKIQLAVTYRVNRKEVKADFKAKVQDKEDVALFLRPDAKVPVGGKPLTLLEGRELPRDQLQLGRFLYDVVNDHMRYSKQGTGWGQGDAVWACDSKYGNCSDFHSLFISLSRSQRIPAKFEMGFPLPEKRGAGEITGYHCWAKFKPGGKGWVPVDISEANKDPTRKEYYFGNLTENRVSLSVGRDLLLVPKQDGPALNFFIYPYVEVEGKAWPDDKIERRFTYQDVDGAR
jgi:transglutaminase-like putative cysteine protease